MKRAGIWKLCLGLLAVLLAFGGCGGSRVVNVPEEPESTASITFFGNKYEAENVKVIEGILSGFMEENPGIRVSYESLKGTGYFEALEKRMAAGKSDDVFMVDHDQVLALSARGKLADLSGLSSIGTYTDLMRGQMESGGKIYWVPTTVSVFGLYCNKDLLREYGREIPGTLPEWEAACASFAERGVTPVICNNDISLKTLAIGIGFYQVYQEGRQEEAFGRLNRGEEPLSSYLSPGFAVAEELIGKGYIDGEKALETQKTSDDLREFAKGESPFLLTGAWAAGRLEGMEPGFDFEVVPLPLLEDGSLLVVNADTRLSVSAESEQPEAAMKFVEYFTRAENIQKFADEQSSFSPLAGGSPSSVKEIQPLVSDYQAGRIVLGTDTRLELPIWSLTAEASKRLLSGASLESAMEWMDTEAAKEEALP